MTSPPFNIHPKTLEFLRIHSTCVYEKALSLATASRYADAIDYIFLREAAMLHDCGIIGVDAPDLYCTGEAPYIAHGIIGARLLRELDPLRFERHARVCERHIGSGLTATEIVQAEIPIPAADYLPETLEEKLITYADNFFSKNPSRLTIEKPYDQIRAQITRFGPGPVARLESLHAMWHTD